MVIVGVVAAVVTAILWDIKYAASVGWVVAAAVYIAWVWIAVGGFDAERTADHAKEEEPTRPVADALVIVLTIASLFSVGYILVQASSAHGGARGVLGGLAIVSVALSWIVLHTLFMLRYARIYYGNGGGSGGGIDFNQKEDPRYTDFAYVSFTLGMTYQVSDTSITDHRIRMTVLGHTLLAFVFGSVILASTVNLIAGLS
jgi:uncharacterized membrane protein